MLTPAQAAGVFAVLVDELAVDPRSRPLFLRACCTGAERVQLTGFLDQPRACRRRLLFVPAEPARLKSPDRDRLSEEQIERAWRASARIEDLLAAPPPTPFADFLGATRRVRLSPLAA